MKRLLLVLPLLLLGCAKQPLPVYPTLDAEPTRQLIHAQSERLRTLQSRAVIELTDSRGESISLDGVLIYENPDRLRIRAWKLGQAVFDLTITPEDVWQYLPRADAEKAMGVTRQIAEGLLEMIGGSLAPDEGTTELSADRVRVIRVTESCMVEHHDYDRQTLALLQIESAAEDGAGRFVLKFSSHRVVDGLVWPMRMEAVSERGVVRITFKEVQINAELPSVAFEPPARAERVR